MLKIRPTFHFAPDQGGGTGGTSPKDAGSQEKTTPGGAPGEGGKTQQDKAGGDPKLMGPDLPSDPELLKSLVLREREEKAHLLSVHADMKTKAEAREAEASKAREEDLKKQGQFQKLLEEQTPKYEQAAQAVKRYEAVLNTYLEAELAAIPDPLKALVPEGDPVSKLDWISKAKAAGALRPSQGSAKKPGDMTPPPGGSSTRTITREAFDQLPADERMAFIRAKGKVTD